MNQNQVCGIMAAIIFNRIIELEGTGYDDAINTSVKVARDLLAAVSRMPNEPMGRK